MKAQAKSLRHTRLVRITHWINALSFVALAVSGGAILLAHPRFYWGETGYFDTPALIELPLPVDLDQTGWGRNVHFMAAWITVLNGLIYVTGGVLSGHFQRKFLPARAQLEWRSVSELVVRHIRLRIPANPSGYNLLQRLAYMGVVFGLLPVVVLSGLTLSPAVTAAFPWLFVLFRGRQSARTIHFFAAIFLLLFMVIHVVMTIVSGFSRNIRSMITGIYAEPVKEK
jgi:thiosulfate reductase cytochrome b subunit